MRTSLLLIPALLAMAACTNEARNDSAMPLPEPAPAAVPADTGAAAPQPANGMVVLHSLAGSGLRFDGVYDSPTSGNIHYYMRFFERGNVALIAGRQEANDPVDLRSFLTENVKSGQNNVHNVPVTLRGDSLFFTTMATRGEIIYAGAIAGDTLRFLKHSRATGKKAIVSYGFLPDAGPMHPIK